MIPEDVAFIERFVGYLLWVADGEPNSNKDQRAEMLKAFQACLIANGIKSEVEVHYRLLAKMTDFAKGVGEGGPPA